MPTALVLFTRDLRVHDHPALAAGAAATAVVPAFVFDDAILSGGFNAPNRTGFLLESLTDLHDALTELGGGLVVRRGDWTAETLSLATGVDATEIHVSDDVSGFARTRLARLEAACVATGITVHRHDGVTVVPPGVLVPSGGGHFQVFTPYYRKWLAAPRRVVAKVPARLNLPEGIETGAIPDRRELAPGDRSPEVAMGGETTARARLDAWTQSGLAAYGDRHDDLPGDATSRISADLHFGCISPLEIETKLSGRNGAEPFIRQLCWRDFYHQALAARPDAAWSDYRPRHDRWNVDDDAFAAWRDGRTGYPVVDAGMRQLAREGFMHNRARMIVASFLTKDLYIDWRRGAQHFLDLLIDGDVANNNLNWQWTAGTGTDTNPHRIFNPTVQAKRFDPDGAYVRRYVAELATVEGGNVHDLGRLERSALGYPDPIVDHHEAIAEYKARFAR
ncbi:MAG: cryptochrome/photolyase family protein [Acidimicrobiia bacterium]